jgi:hypothetical protein
LTTGYSYWLSCFEYNLIGDVILGICQRAGQP